MTAIGTFLAILSFGFYLAEKTFNILDWAMQDDQQSIMRPEVSVGLQFPYERVNESVKQNKRNPKLTITNRGSKIISPIKADVVMFMLEQSLDKVISAGILNYETHGHLIFEPELKPGLSVSASLPGVKNWTKPAAYRINIEVIILNEKKLPDLSLLYLIDKDGINAEGSKLSESTASKIRKAIQRFEKDEDIKKKVTLNAPMDGVWVPHAEPGVNLKLNEDGTLTVK
ncbi:MAG: hypothetical protein MIO92_02275 [Methanosarcinaceae archaeon]|nr:hypothetical protein [Methanosarcinaceae archaeon]